MNIDDFPRHCYYYLLSIRPSPPEAMMWWYRRNEDNTYKMAKYSTSPETKNRLYSQVDEQLLNNIRRSSSILGEILNIKNTIKHLIEYTKFRTERRRDK